MKIYPILIPSRIWVVLSVMMEVQMKRSVTVVKVHYAALVHFLIRLPLQAGNGHNCILQKQNLKAIPKLCPVNFAIWLRMLADDK